MSKTTLPSNTSELLTNIDREWSALLRVVDQLTPEQMTTPDAGGWSPKDNLAHLTEWLKILLGYHLDKRPAHEVVGSTPEMTRDWDPDIINRFLFEQNRLRSSCDILDELKHVYAEVVARLKVTPFDELMKPRHADDPDRQPLLYWVLGNTTGHFSEHRASIKKIMKK
jgi:hypothetical protein